MTKSVYGVHEAKTHLSTLLARVADGEEVLISRRGEVVARLVAVTAPRHREFGRDLGRVTIGDDFDSPLPDDILAGFAQ